MNILIWYPKCSTCKNAKKYLDINNINYELRDIKEEKLNEKELDKIIKKSGKDIKSFFNTSGLVYKELGLKDKLINMAYEEKISLLASNGMLIKRPIFLTDDTILIGFKEDNWKSIIN